MIETKQKIIEIIKEEADIDFKTIDHGKDIKSQIKIDSITYVGILAAIVEELGVQVPVDIMKANTFNEIVSSIEMLIVKKGAENLIL